MEIIDILSRLTAAPGVSGDEKSAANSAAEILREYGDARFDSKTGNVYFKSRGWDDKKPTVLVDAHIDEIGMVVTYITDDGFLKVSNCGGLDNRVLLAQQVTVYGSEKLIGVVISTPPHLEKDNTLVPDVDDIYIDIGYDGEQVKKLVRPGDIVLIENELKPLQNGRVTSKALDDRSGMAAVILALDMLRNKELNVNIAVLFSSQEEVGERGAKTGAFAVNPDLAIIVDVSFAATNGESDENCGELGKGPMIGISPSLSRRMSDLFVKLAKESNIPYQLEVMNGRTGTNADVIGITNGGIPAVTISIPEKHMHTPAEIADLSDIENTAKLIAEFLESVYDII